MLEIKEKYFLKGDEEVWTPEGFKQISGYLVVEGVFEMYEIKVDSSEKIRIPCFFRVRTPAGYIPPDKIRASYDAVMFNSKKSLNVYRTVLEVRKKITSDKIVIPLFGFSPLSRTISRKEAENKYSCLNEKGIKDTLKLKEIYDKGYLIQTGDEFKEIFILKFYDEETNFEEESSGVIILNMNNGMFYLNDIAVIPDLKVVKELKRIITNL